MYKSPNDPTGKLLELRNEFKQGHWIRCKQNQVYFQINNSNRTKEKNS